MALCSENRKWGEAASRKSQAGNPHHQLAHRNPFCCEGQAPPPPHHGPRTCTRVSHRVPGLGPPEGQPRLRGEEGVPGHQEMSEAGAPLILPPSPCPPRRHEPSEQPLRLLEASWASLGFQWVVQITNH